MIRKSNRERIIKEQMNKKIEGKLHRGMEGGNQEQ